MENLCKGAIFGLAVGMVIGGVLVAKNKKLAGKVKEGVDMAEQKMEKAKDMVKEKIEECQDKNDQQTHEINYDDEMKEFSTKNSKK